jgi:glycosyltransferase involved in cell wall biosynthesis
MEETNDCGRLKSSAVVAQGPRLAEEEMGAIPALRVRGPFRGPSGYDHHVREFVRALHRLGIAIELVDVSEWGPVRLPPEAQDPWFETLSGPVGARVTLHCTMPHQVIPDGAAITANYTMFEATRIPASWAAQSEQCDLVIVPTESSRRAWLAGGAAPARLRVCPLGVDAALYGRGHLPLLVRDAQGRPIGSYRIRLLSVAELGPRKNLMGLLRAWLLATSRDDDAVLILKLGAYAPWSREAFQADVARLQRELGRRLSDAAPLCLLFDLFSDAAMPRLYAAATHYISLSHGEGWDQAMVEAAASGLRLIAPAHSAYTAYLYGSVATLIPSREVPAVFEGDPFFGDLFRGLRWWEPDEGAAMAAIRAAIAGSDTAVGSPRERTLRDLTWDAAARRLAAILSEAL